VLWHPASLRKVLLRSPTHRPAVIRYVVSCAGYLSGPEVLENFIYDLRLFNARDLFHPGGAPLAATFLTFLNPEAAPSIAKTRFSRCAQLWP